MGSSETDGKDTPTDKDVELPDLSTTSQREEGEGNSKQRILLFHCQKNLTFILPKILHCNMALSFSLTSHPTPSLPCLILFFFQDLLNRRQLWTHQALIETGRLPKKPLQPAGLKQTPTFLKSLSTIIQPQTLLLQRLPQLVSMDDFFLAMASLLLWYVLDQEFRPMIASMALSLSAIALIQFAMTPQIGKKNGNETFQADSKADNLLDKKMTSQTSLVFCITSVSFLVIVACLYQIVHIFKNFQMRTEPRQPMWFEMHELNI